MTNGNEPAVAITKREQFAVSIFSRMFSFNSASVERLVGGDNPRHELAARTAVDAADALIDALNKEAK